MTEELLTPPSPTMFRFPDEATGMDAIKTAGFAVMDEDGIVHLITASHNHALDVVGTISRGGEWDEDGNMITPPKVLEGWHINYRGVVPDEWLQYAVWPEQPARVFA